MSASFPEIALEPSSAFVPVLRRDPPIRDATSASLIRRKRAEFARLAPQYELQCRIATFGRIGALRAMTAEAAVGNVDGPVLELCCGTGGVTVELARRFQRVFGVDLSPHMMARARKRITRLGLQNVALVEHDVGSLELPDEAFSAVVISLGVHEFPRALREHVLQSCMRWLKPGGRLVIVDYRMPKNRLWQMMFRFVGSIVIEDEFFAEYLTYSIPDRMKELGFEMLQQRSMFLSCLQLLVGRRPDAAPRAALPAPVSIAG